MNIRDFVITGFDSILYVKDKKGQTLRQYIISYRLKSAKRALELTDKSTAESAEENGFTDASYAS